MKLDSLWVALDEHLLPILRSYRAQLATLTITKKPDKTLLSEADLATQQFVVSAILDMFPGSGFIAEEDDEVLPRAGSPLWIIDPIDGTSEFLKPEGREFCSVVCLLDQGIPAAAYVLAPELGSGRSPISIHWSSDVRVNGEPARILPARSMPRQISATRSKGTDPRSYERDLANVGATVKLRTTSQTLDMVRTAMDLSDWADRSNQQFDVFYRRNQKIWDGAAGIGLCNVMGRLVCDCAGGNLLPFSPDLLALREPILPGTVAGDPTCARWFLNLLRN